MDELDNLINELNNPFTLSSNARPPETSNAAKIIHPPTISKSNATPNPQFSELDSLMADLVDARVAKATLDSDAGIKPLQELLTAKKEHVDYSRALPTKMNLTKSTPSNESPTVQKDNESREALELDPATDRPQIAKISERAPHNSVYPIASPNQSVRDNKQAKSSLTNSADALNQLLYEQEALAKRRNQLNALANTAMDLGSASSPITTAKIDITRPHDNFSSTPPTLKRGEGPSVQYSTFPRTMPAVQPAVRTEICPQCNEPVVGPSFSALHRIWHPDHFICFHCKKKLGSVTFFEHEGTPYCAEDYHELFSPRCGYCSGVITEQCITAIGKVWHPDHFFCCQCGKNFADGGFMEHEGRAYCEDDYFNMFAPKCGGCKAPIMSESVNALGKDWHTACFVCKECQKPFTSGSFFDYDNEPYCETHFHTKQGSLCAGCQRPIIGRCVTAIGKKFHPEHFVCQYCAKQLSKGAFKEAQGKPYCPGCHIKLFS